MGKETAAPQDQEGVIADTDKQDQSQDEGSGLKFGMDEEQPADKGTPDPDADKEESAAPEEEEQPADDAPADKADEEAPAEEIADDDIPLEEQNKFTAKEKGLYQSLKKERASRQQIEAELQYLRLHQKYAPKPAESESEDEAPVEETDPVVELFKDKTDDDIVTVADVKKVLEAERAKTAKVESKKADVQAKLAVEQRELVEQAKVVEKRMSATIKDFDEATYYAGQLMDKHRGLYQEFYSIAKKEGAEAAAKWAYKLGKDHKEFGTGKFAASDPEAKKRADAKKAIANAAKPKTSVNAGPGNKTPLKMSHQELLDMEPEDLANTLANMSETEFAKVPRHIRKKAMQAVG